MSTVITILSVRAALEFTFLFQMSYEGQTGGRQMTWEDLGMFVNY